MRKQGKTVSFFALILLLIAVGTSAAEEEEKAAGWMGDAALSLGLTRGNSETTTLALSASLKKEWGNAWSFEENTSFFLTRMSGETTAENMGLTARISRRVSKSFFIFGEMQALRDRFKNYSYRFLPQIGVGIAVLNTEKLSLDFTGGLTQVITRYRQTADNDTYTGLVLGNKWRWKISETADVLESLSFNTDFSNLGRFSMRLEVSLTSALTKLLAVRISLIDSYDNRPVGAGIKKNDLALLAGLSIKF
jgi:putative salt-induced outer membrane protein YdiY